MQQQGWMKCHVDAGPVCSFRHARGAVRRVRNKLYPYSEKPTITITEQVRDVQDAAPIRERGSGLRRVLFRCLERSVPQKGKRLIDDLPGLERASGIDNVRSD